LSNTSRENANNQVQAGSASTDLVAFTMAKVWIDVNVVDSKAVLKGGVIIALTAISQPASF
jgi:hypothetical protein